MLRELRIAVLIISDRAADGTREDKTSPLLKKLIEENGGHCSQFVVVPDDEDRIRNNLISLSQQEDIDVIVTSGGTGIGPRDITVDVTKQLIEKELPGFGEEMRRKSMEVTPYGILSRATAGILNDTLILNLPGNPRASVDCLGWVLKPLSHLVRVMKRRIKDCPTS